MPVAADGKNKAFHKDLYWQTGTGFPRTADALTRWGRIKPWRMAHLAIWKNDGNQCVGEEATYHLKPQNENHKRTGR